MFISLTFIQNPCLSFTYAYLPIRVIKGVFLEFSELARTNGA